MNKHSSKSGGSSFWDNVDDSGGDSMTKVKRRE
jgi:hypothetical protein